jgi:hypothetical protein
VIEGDGVDDLQRTIDDLVHGTAGPGLDCPVCGVMHDLEKTIARLNQLKAAHPQDSEHWLHFQTRIDTLTDAWRAAEEKGPPLAAVNQRIRAQRRDVQDAEFYAKEIGGKWFRPAAAAAVAGVILTLVGTGFGMTWWLWLLAVALLLGAVGGAWMGVRARMYAWGDLEDAQDDLHTLHEQQKPLIPTRHTTT